jgi:hypothetical protein
MIDKNFWQLFGTQIMNFYVQAIDIHRWGQTIIIRLIVSPASAREGDVFELHLDNCSVVS